MTTARQWWRRAAAAAKDRRSLYLTRMAALRPATAAAAAALRNAELEAAVIRATSHDERSVDYRSAARVFALARASPAVLQPLMWALARRAGRTRCWAVALKSLMLAHGLLLRSDLAPRAARLGRVPFDLADFRDRSSSPAKTSGFSAFVRAYFHFLDTRSLFAAQDMDASANNNNHDADDDEDARLDGVSRLQHLLDLLMQIRPYGDGMEQGLILEAMDCVVIEIFEVYSQICTGIARFLVGVLGSAPTTPRPRPGETMPAARRRRGLQGIRVLRKASEQSAQLTSYFELCRSLGVLNAAEFPAVERVPDDDIRDLEKLIMSHVEDSGKEKVSEEKALVAVENTGVASGTVVTREWVVFDDDVAGAGGAMQGHFGHYVNPFLGAPWEAVTGSGNLLV
uniref:ENTH domain-containing protein n=1 Tax=Oryza punctata TaxID=4537 RepID=A0A0E0LVR2_ORYPU